MENAALGYGADLVQSVDYVLHSGSTIIEFQTGYLSTLATGEYQFFAAFSDGYMVEGEFSIVAMSSPEPLIGYTISYTPPSAS